jgi:cytochrome c oxidase subunit 2
MDVIPGRLKSGSVIPMELGKFFGQCSEICGANHRFMPIEIEVLQGGRSPHTRDV